MLRLFFFALCLFPCLLMAQISITPKIGFEYGGLSYYPKSTIKESNIKIAIPEGKAFLSIELSLLQKNKKLSFAVEAKNMIEGITIFDDSLVFLDGFRGNGHYGKFIGNKQIFLGLFYDRIKKNLFSSKALAYFYGAGVGIGFNRSDAYFRETQNAGYSLVYWGGTNFARIERWSKPTGHGIFLKLRGHCLA